MLAPTASMLMTTAPISSELMAWVGGRYVGGDLKWDSLTIEDAGSNARGTTSFRIEGRLADYPEVYDQAQVRFYDHTADAEVFNGYIRARRPLKTSSAYDAIEIMGARTHKAL